MFASNFFLFLSWFLAGAIFNVVMVKLLPVLKQFDKHQNIVVSTLSEVSRMLGLGLIATIYSYHAGADVLIRMTSAYWLAISSCSLVFLLVAHKVGWVSENKKYI